MRNAMLRATAPISSLLPWWEECESPLAFGQLGFLTLGASALGSLYSPAARSSGQLPTSQPRQEKNNFSRKAREKRSVQAKRKVARKSS